MADFKAISVYKTLDAPTGRASQRAAGHMTRRRWVSTALGLLSLLLLFTVTCRHSPTDKSGIPSADVSTSVCEQAEPLAPQSREDITENYRKIFKEQTPFRDTFKTAAAERLSEAIKIETISYDFLRNKTPLPDDVPDPSREGFLKFHTFLEARFEKVHATLKREVINRYSLLYTWEGTDKDLEPILLMSHIDTVPVPNATLDQWSYPPFEGHNDGKYVWGRGSVDTKSTLLAILEAVEVLLQLDFKPKRTVILGFGSDEEISGHQGAKFIANTLLSRGLKDKIAFLIDEGTGLEDVNGITVAEIATQEKGYTDIQISIETPGGHSSIPPDHTGIGILAEIIHAAEGNPYTPQLDDDHPFLEALRCQARFAEDMDAWLRKAVMHIGKYRKHVIERLSEDLYFRYLMRTSQAVDLIEGGVKVNALPELTSATINQRVAIHQQAKDVPHHLLRVISPIAQKRNLTLIESSVDNHNRTHNDDGKPKWGKVTVKIIDQLEPSPRSPSNGKTWDVMGGTIQHVFGRTESKVGGSGEDKKPDVVVAPALMPANTDTRHYWDLTRNIYRFDARRVEETFGVHTIDERIGIDAYLECISFYHEIIRNADEMQA
ncbi:hypothetical protein HDV00_000823 [Rhizophlyctis rosea]|nr:hypothetical protein HDV00_000823 [Rhizophlyctis rosea]